MKILNVMFCKKLGGLQQVFADYDKALRNEIEVINLIHPKARIKEKLIAQNSKFHEISNFSQYDIRAIFRIRRLIKRTEPGIIIVHGNRAAELCKKAVRKKIPIIAVCHNKRIKRLIGLDYLFVILDALKNHAISLGQDPEKIFYVPNMINVTNSPKAKENWHSPVVIGALGRFVTEKAFDVLLDALMILKKDKIPFKAVVAGTGPLEEELKEQLQKNDLENHVKFLGWIDNQEKFFADIDIFCLSSRIEHFSIAMLEAMKYRTPIVACDATGPAEVIINEKDGLVVPKDDPQSLANALREAIANQEKMQKLENNLFNKLQKNFTEKAVGNKIIQILTKIQNDKK